MIRALQLAALSGFLVGTIARGGSPWMVAFLGFALGGAAVRAVDEWIWDRRR